MGLIRKRLAKGNFNDSLTIIYTTPTTGGSYTLATGIWLCNKSEDDVEITLKMAGTEILYKYELEGKESLALNLKEANIILEAGELIEGLANLNDKVSFYISGVEVVS